MHEALVFIPSTSNTQNKNIGQVLRVFELERLEKRAVALDSKRADVYVEGEGFLFREKILELRPTRHWYCQQPTVLLGFHVK